MVSATASDKIMEKILFVRTLFLVNFFLLPFFVSMSSNLPLQAGHFLLGYRCSGTSLSFFAAVFASLLRLTPQLGEDVAYMSFDRRQFNIHHLPPPFPLFSSFLHIFY